jgi:outer membrane protein TolC
MPASGWFHRIHGRLPFACLLIVLGCEPKSDPAVQTDSTQRASRVAAERLAKHTEAPKPSQDVPVQPMRPTDTQPAPSAKDIDAQVRDPGDEAATVQAEHAGIPAALLRIDSELRTPGLPPVRKQALEQQKSDLIERQKACPRLIARVQSIVRPNVVRLTLTDAIHRALLNSQQIQIAAYAPAIDAARVVEAEAQFDAVFFSEFSYDKKNRPSSSQLTGTNSDNRAWQTGIRKLLSSGMQVQTGYSVTRTSSDLVYQTLNPAYSDQFFVEFRQPLLKSFGTDYTRSQAESRKLDRSINEEKLRQQIRENLFNVEQAYWRLYEARRNITVVARLLTDLETILYSLRQRYELGFDVYKVQVSMTESRYEKQVAQFVQLRNQVYQAEDTLKALLNDPQLNLVHDLEIIPVDAPVTEPLIIDRIGEVTAALSYRSELHEARLQIQQAQIAIGVAKNQALPKLDLTFRYVVDGLGANWDRSFSQLSENDFNEYLLQLQFEWPIGARSGEAVIRQARLQQAQAIASHRGQIEQVILETQNAIRDIYTAYDQIGPNMRSALAAADQLYATQARMQRLDLPNLQVELDAHELLASSRQSLLQSVSDYNISLINLERRKGTLLTFNNIVLNAVSNESFLDPYRPVGP